MRNKKEIIRGLYSQLRQDTYNRFHILYWNSQTNLLEYKEMSDGRIILFHNFIRDKYNNGVEYGIGITDEWLDIWNNKL